MKNKNICTFVIMIIFVIFSFLIYKFNIIQPLDTPNESQESHISKLDLPQKLSELQPLLSLDPSSNGINPNGLISLKIIDISNNTIINDWKVVKENVDGIYIKATEGTTFTSPVFGSYANAAIRTQIPIGFYHYFWPKSNLEYAKQQADYFYNTIKKYKYDFYPVLDIEETNGQDAKTITANVKTFLEEFNRVSNQKIMCYCSPNFANEYLTDKSFSKYPLWIANYNVNAPINTIVWDIFDVWQYSVNISISGISGDIDGDIATSDIYINKDLAPKM